MECFKITGGKPLKGTVQISGAKNAASKMMIASLLTSDPVFLSNVPQQDETQITEGMLRELGTEVVWKGEHEMRLQTTQVHGSSLPSLARRNRIGILALVPLLHRTGEAIVPFSGGDAIGARPVDFHLATLKKMGATITETEEGYKAQVNGRLKGALIELPYPSVGATESAILAGVLAAGRTMIRNAAGEPEVQQLIMMLQKMGAIIQINAGRSIEIVGIETLSGCCMRTMPDRMEAASYACMALGTHGEIFVKDAPHEHMVTFLNMVRKIGGEYEVQEDGIVFRAINGFSGMELETDTHPGFMTGWQQPFVVLLTQAKGTSVVHETVYEGRFGYTEALKKMGAQIALFSNCLGEIDCRFKGQNYKHSAVITGPTPLHAADVEVPDIRAGLAFVVAALMAEGTSTLSGIEHLDRGYETLEEKLKGVGAKIVRI